MAAKTKPKTKQARPALAYPFHIRRGVMHCEGVNLKALTENVGAPAFVYSAGRIRAAFNYLKESFREADPLLAYSLKANSTRRILELLNELGGAFDVTSAGELQRALAAGARPGRIIFAGVGKTDEELELALRKKIFLFNVESPSEARHINAIAGRLGRRASIALRVNPGVDAPAPGRFEVRHGLRETPIAVGSGESGARSRVSGTSRSGRSEKR